MSPKIPGGERLTRGSSGRLRPRAEPPQRSASKEEAVLRFGRNGKDLERLVAFLERALANKDVIVESPFRVKDKRTGRLREHDVVLTSRLGHHPVHIAIECRDRKRPVGVPQVEAFYQKCIDTDMGHAAIASSMGFSETARRKAESFGIRCLDLTTLSEVDWLALRWLPILHSHVDHVEMTVFVKEEGISGLRPTGFIDSEGRTVSQTQLTEFLDRCLRESVLEQVAGPGRHAIPFDFGLDGLYGSVEGRDEVLHVNRVRGTAYYVTEVKAEPYQLLGYEDKGHRLADAAVAEVKVGALQGKLMITLDAQRNASAAFIPSSIEAPNQPPAADGSRRR